MVAGIVANALYPVDTTYNMMVNPLSYYTCELNVNRISPYYLYGEAVSTIMNPSVRTINAVTMNQMVGAISGYLSFGQSLLLVWPHLTGLIAMMMVAFAAAYVGFMRQEVRSN